MQAACVLAEDGLAILLEQELIERSARISKACDAFLKITEGFRSAFKHNPDLSNNRQVLECKEELRIKQSNAKAQLMHKQHELDRLGKREEEVMRDLREQGQHLASILQLQGSRGLHAI